MARPFKENPRTDRIAFRIEPDKRKRLTGYYKNLSKLLYDYSDKLLRDIPEE
jgi:hypothetical protein